jgi:hypothetical protein
MFVYPGIGLGIFPAICYEIYPAGKCILEKSRSLGIYGKPTSWRWA